MSQECKDLRLKLPEYATVGDVVKVLKKFDQTAEFCVSRKNDDLLHNAKHVTMTPYTFSEVKYVHLHIDE